MGDYQTSGHTAGHGVEVAVTDHDSVGVHNSEATSGGGLGALMAFPDESDYGAGALATQGTAPVVPHTNSSGGIDSSTEDGGSMCV